MRINEADIQRVRSEISELVAEYHLPGISVGIVSEGVLAYSEGFGYADIESRRTQDPALRQRIGSITKTMTALCAMALEEDGKLSLEDRVADLLPDLALSGHGDSLTVWHLFTHTGGIGEAPTMSDFLDPYDKALWSATPDGFTIPGSYPDGILVEVEPGTKWAYANHAWGLLGEIVARIEGEPIEEVLRRRIFEPLEMQDTDCLDRPHSDLTTGYHRAQGHDERDLADLLGNDWSEEETADGHNIRGSWLYVGPRAAGAVQSTIPDMARYSSALLAQGGGIVRPETFERMVLPQWCPDDRLDSIGLAFFLQQRFGRSSFGHGGGIAGGWNTHLSVLPDDGLAVLVHLNLAFAKFSEVTSRIVRAVVGAAPLELAGKPTDPSTLESAPGVYGPAPGHLTNFRSTRGTGRVQITARDEHLELRSRHGDWREGVRMVQSDSDDPSFFILDTGEAEPPRVVLEPGDDGETAAIRFDRFKHMTRDRSLEPWA